MKFVFQRDLVSRIIAEHWEDFDSPMDGLVSGLYIPGIKIIRKSYNLRI
jgi:hypothetical protein